MVKGEDRGTAPRGRRKPSTVDVVPLESKSKGCKSVGKKRGSKPSLQFDELESLKIQTDAYEHDLEEFKKILGDDFVAQESFRREAVPSHAATQALELGYLGIRDSVNSYLRHGSKRFGDGMALGEEKDKEDNRDAGDAVGGGEGEDGGARVFAGDKFATDVGAAEIDQTGSQAVLSQFFANLYPERENISRAVELNLKMQKRMELLVASNRASLVECDALAARITEIEREKRQRVRDLEHGRWRLALGQSGMEYDGGRSWFFKGARYINSRDFVDVAKHLPLISKSGEWNEEEREGLLRGIEEMAKERRALNLMDRVEYIEDFVKLQRENRLAELELLNNYQDTTIQSVDAEPLSDAGEGGAAGDPAMATASIAASSLRHGDVAEEAEAMTAEEWNLIAWRHIPKRSGIECMLQWHNAMKPSLKTGPFSGHEQKKLRQLAKRYGEHADGWEIISSNFPGRSPLLCLQEYTREGRAEEARAREKERRVGNLFFTDDDVQRVRQLVLKHGQSWKKIAKEFGGSWTPQQIMFEWRKHLQSTGGGIVAAKKGKWSKDEDDKLVKAVAVLGRQWAKVAHHVPGRTEMQVRERYVNHLDPQVESNQPFTDEELSLVRREVPKHTNTQTGRVSWAKVARMLPSRTDRQVKKAWERLLRVATRPQKKGRAKRKRNPWDDEDDE